MIFNVGLSHARAAVAVAGLSLACPLLAACGDEIAPGPDKLAPLPPTTPREKGPYAVGVTTFETTDGEPGGRTLPVEVWYPATPPQAAPPAHYQLMLGSLVIADMGSPLGAVRDATADPRGAPHPVVIFSHGFGGVRFQSIYLTEYLASHGFVVAAPDHVGNTFHEQVDKASAISGIEAARLRPIDVSRTLDALLDRSALPSGLLSGQADPSRVGIAGHSFGGFTAFRIAGATLDVKTLAAQCEGPSPSAICDGYGQGPLPPVSARDDRFIAAIPQAPGIASIFGPEGFGAIAVPTMIQGGLLDETMPFATEQAAPFAELTVPAYLVGIDRGGHFTFSNMCDLLDLLSLDLDAFDDGCGAANIPASEAHPAINRFATAFALVTIAGDTTFADELDPAVDLPPAVASFAAR
ncbi:MAG: dienelactone hydrolase family protein [Byssovorax sp.]